MREHKYRGKRKDTGEWVCGYLNLMSYRAWIKDISDQYTNPRRLDGINHTADIRCVEVDPETVGEYTGLKDKNGKEIYEGDIVECELYPNLPSTIDYGPEDLVFRLVCEYGADASFHLRRIPSGKPYGLGYSGSAVKRKEVIGDIHDNPDLLEVKP